MFIWSKMLSSSIDKLLKVSKTTSPQKLFAYDCVTLYLPTFNLFSIKGLTFPTSTFALLRISENRRLKVGRYLIKPTLNQLIYMQ